MDQVGEIKSKVEIVDVVRERLSLKKAGRNYKGLCPFHSEKTPSFMVNPELQIYKCFGCGESGDVINFLMKYEGIEFGDALSELAERAGVKLKPFQGGVNVSERQRVIELNEMAARLYSYLLLKHELGKVGLEYLKKRKIERETIRKWGLGFAPNKPNVLVNFMKKKGIGATEMEKAGLVIMTGRGPLDRFRGRVIFPIRDQRGRVIALGGRVLPEYDTGRVGKYINSPETVAYKKSESLYGLDMTKGQIRKSGKVVVVEGEMDLLSAWQANVGNVVAIKGSALTEEQARILARFTDEVILALDSDFAGDKAAVRGIAEIQKVGLDIWVARMGEYKDPDDFAREDPEGFKKALGKAVGVWDFMIEVVVEGGGSKTKLSRELTLILTAIEDRIMQAHYAKKVAEILNVPFEAVEEQVEEVGKGKRQNLTRLDRQDKGEKKVEEPRRERLETRLLAIMFQEGEEVLASEEWEKFIVGALARKILRKYREYRETTDKFEVGRFFESLPAELREGFGELYMREVELEEGTAREEIEQVKRGIWEMELTAKMEKLMKEIKDLEVKGGEKELNLKVEEFARLSKLRARAEEE